jgi:methyltransferase FkbM-like protein
LWRDHVRGQPICLAFDNDFSIILRLYPDYGYNLARVASACLEKYPNLHLIDIGSAAGDTVTQLRLYGKFPILAINPGVSGLKRNFGECSDITIVDAFVSGRTAHGVTVPTVSNSETSTLTLSEILKRHPQFKQARIIKVDTDGVDCAILRDNEVWLRENRPVVFFEYEPRFASLFKDTTADIFPYLSSVGYETAMIYSSNGVFLFSTQLAALEIWKELHHSLLRYTPTSYFDICVFSNTDRDVYAKARDLELRQPNID